MKSSIKKIMAVLSAASLLFLGACADKPVSTPKNESIEVAVDDFTAEFVFGDNGLIEKEKKFYDNMEVTYEYYECYEYNEDSQITKRYATDLEGNVLEEHDYFEMTYNEDGDIKNITEGKINYNFIYNEDGSLKGYAKYEGTQVINAVAYNYDENGYKTKETASKVSDETVSETVYTYNENGLVLSSVTKSKNGVVTNEESREYNADGVLTKLIKTTDRNIRTTVYEYKDGVLVKETTTVALSGNYSDTRARDYVTTYEYFGNGSVVKFERARDGEVYITDAYSVDEAKGNYADFDGIISL